MGGGACFGAVFYWIQGDIVGAKRPLYGLFITRFVWIKRLISGRVAPSYRPFY